MLPLGDRQVKAMLKWVGYPSAKITSLIDQAKEAA
jgi:hypothetical protein